MRLLSTTILAIAVAACGMPTCHASGLKAGADVTVSTADGTLHLTPLADNAVRVRFCKNRALDLPEWVYVDNASSADIPVDVTENASGTVVRLPRLTLGIDKASGLITYSGADGNKLVSEIARGLNPTEIAGTKAYSADAVFDAPEGEILMGLGQFQDGYVNVRGLSRRLTQVNTQISIPMVISSRGYGLLWNNYGMTDFNIDRDSYVAMRKASSGGNKVEVDVTSTSGGKKEIREDNLFTAELNVPSDGRYALLLDVGRDMARHHNLAVDDSMVINIDNLWLPPTASAIVDLKAGTHSLTSRLDKNDSPTVYFRKVDDTTTFFSPVADCVDYTVFSGTADEVIASYREATGGTPLMPLWSLGYIHCRERFHSQNELLSTAKTFRDKDIPVDVIVQDWQYWGKNGWNAMVFDSDSYPSPKEMVDSLHSLDMKMMLSVWSKIDPESELGRKAAEKGYFIPGTQWIDFFNPEAAEFYWTNFSDRLLSLGIDAWWQDATEPENDDLRNRRVMNGTVPGEVYRNVYPLLVNKTVYEGCRRDAPSKRSMILTRSAFPGIQRYGTAMWTGDVGNDWQTLRIQLKAGLDFAASGMPWWTYDAGGFFRPGNQHTNPEYIECMLRWIQASAFLPLMRVHGYMSDTEPWLYGDEAQRIITECINLRYRMLPYIYSEAAQVTLNGSTIMRPLMFDFPADKTAAANDSEYMFGHSILVNPVTAPGASSWKTYLPQTEGGWTDFRTGKHYDGGQYVDTPVTIEQIPVFVKAGAILPLGAPVQHSVASSGQPMELNVYPGADGYFELYEDDGTTYGYEQGDYSVIPIKWDNATRTLTLEKARGARPVGNKEFTVKAGGSQTKVRYNGKRIKLKIKN